MALSKPQIGSQAMEEQHDNPYRRAPPSESAAAASSEPAPREPVAAGGAPEPGSAAAPLVKAPVDQPESAPPVSDDEPGQAGVWAPAAAEPAENSPEPEDEAPSSYYDAPYDDWEPETEVVSRDTEATKKPGPAAAGVKRRSKGAGARGLRELPKDFDDLATGKVDRLRRPPRAPSPLEDTREGAVIPGVRNSEARAVYDAHVGRLRDALVAGRDQELAEGLFTARQLELWRARNITDYQAFAENVVGINPLEAESLAARGAEGWQGGPSPVPAQIVALLIRSEAALLQRPPHGRAHLRTAADGRIELEIRLTASDVASAIESLSDLGHAVSGMKRFLRPNSPAGADPRDEIRDADLRNDDERDSARRDQRSFERGTTDRVDGRARWQPRRDSERGQSERRDGAGDERARRQPQRDADRSSGRFDGRASDESRSQPQRDADRSAGHFGERADDERRSQPQRDTDRSSGRFDGRASDKRRWHQRDAGRSSGRIDDRASDKRRWQPQRDADRSQFAAREDARRQAGRFDERGPKARRWRDDQPAHGSDKRSSADRSAKQAWQPKRDGGGARREPTRGHTQDDRTRTFQGKGKPFRAKRGPDSDPSRDRSNQGFQSKHPGQRPPFKKRQQRNDS